MSRQHLGRLVAGIGVSALLVGASATPAFAHECVNASKVNQDAGIQIVINTTTNDIAWMSTGLQRRAAAGLVDLETGEGFHGLLGLDFDGDGAVDVATWIVAPDGEIPEAAQWNGATCKGVVYIEDWFNECATTPV